MVNLHQTRSYAVAKRPHDASCLSVVSFSSTKRRVQSSISSYTLALDLPLRKLNYVLFSFLRCIHWCVAYCVSAEQTQSYSSEQVTKMTFEGHPKVIGNVTVQ